MPDPELTWITSSYSQGNGCVEAAAARDRVLVRDTRDRAGAALRFTPAAWRTFADQLKRSLPLRCLRSRSTASRGTPAVINDAYACTFPGHGRGGSTVRCVSGLILPVTCSLAEQSRSVPDLALLSC